MPVGKWLRGDLRDLARDTLLGPGRLDRIRREPVERMLREHDDGTVDHRQRLWSLLVLELWRCHHGVA